MIVKIVLPLPPKELHPNSRNHWRAKLKPKKMARTLAFVKTNNILLLSRPAIPRRFFTKADLRCHWYFKTNHKHDTGNLIAWIKAYEDGIVQAGLLTDDDKINYLYPVIGKDKANSRLEMIFTLGV